MGKEKRRAVMVMMTESESRREVRSWVKERESPSLDLIRMEAVTTFPEYVRL